MVYSIIEQVCQVLNKRELLKTLDENEFKILSLRCKGFTRDEISEIMNMGKGEVAFYETTADCKLGFQAVLLEAYCPYVKEMEDAQTQSEG